MQQIHDYLSQFEPTYLGGVEGERKGYTFVTSFVTDCRGGILHDYPGELNYYHSDNEIEAETKHLEQIKGIIGVMQTSGMIPKVRTMTRHAHNGEWLFTRITFEKVNT